MWTGGPKSCPWRSNDWLRWFWATPSEKYQSVGMDWNSQLFLESHKACILCIQMFQSTNGRHRLWPTSCWIHFKWQSQTEVQTEFQFLNGTRAQEPKSPAPMVLARRMKIPSGKHTKNYWKWPIEIIDLPMKTMVIFHRFFVNVDQRVSPSNIPLSQFPFDPLNLGGTRMEHID